VLGLALRQGACSFHTHGLVCWGGSFTNRNLPTIGTLISQDRCMLLGCCLTLTCADDSGQG
jgi:hypothetical protein